MPFAARVAAGLGMLLAAVHSTTLNEVPPSLPIRRPPPGASRAGFLWYIWMARHRLDSRRRNLPPEVMTKLPPNPSSSRRSFRSRRSMLAAPGVAAASDVRGGGGDAPAVHPAIGAHPGVPRRQPARRCARRFSGQHGVGWASPVWLLNFTTSPKQYHHLVTGQPPHGGGVTGFFQIH